MPQRLSRFVVGLGLVAALGLVSACGNGLESGTSQETARVPGDGISHGSLGLHDFFLVTPTTGATSTWLAGAIANHGARAETLSSVTVSQASAVDILSPGQSVPLPAIGPSASSSPTAPLTPSGGSVQIPGNSLVSFFPPSGGQPTPGLRVIGLQAPLRSGDTVQVTFDFTNAGAISLRVPVTTAPVTSD